jgi:tungstate transport system substrate-binding protein
MCGGSFAAMPTRYALSRRRTAIALAAVTAVVAATTVSASPASADKSNTLTVVGTSDVFDSNLIQSVIKPGFEAAYPGITLNYVSLGTGAAIAYAEAGNASALLVHAPSLENQFVAAGYSSKPAGDALFWGDYVLLGPQSDPVGIATKAPHDIAKAFELVAAAGAKHEANFVSRGGTPGTTVQEHAIWGLTKTVKTCTVSTANGGGESPSKTTGDCPASISYPNWYHATGLTQGPNIVNADACNYSGGNCYVLTDRGTYNYLQSTGAAQNLKIVTRNNSATARGGIALLVNSFHAYSVNPDAFPDTVKINKAGALDFLHWVTSPAGQTAVGQYLNGTNDPPFIPDASPRITATAPPATLIGHGSVTIKGTLSNVVPGTAILADQPVALYGTDDATPPVTTQIATTMTNSAGKYSFTFAPKQSRTYTVETPELTQVEYPLLSPPFSDRLAPSSTVAGSTQMVGLPQITRATPMSGALKLAGTTAPARPDANGKLTLYATKDGGSEMVIGTMPLSAGGTDFTKVFPIASGNYTYRVAYSDDPYIAQGFSAPGTVTVP